MPWTWVRPADPTLLAGRPLLDLGTGDGQTLATLVGGRDAGVVGVDHDLVTLSASRRRPTYPVVGAEADDLPLRDGTFATVLAADLFHHLDDHRLAMVLSEVGRVLRPGGRLIAWWYEHRGRDGPDAPRFPRRYDEVARAVHLGGLVRADELVLETTIEPSPATVGIVASR